MVQYVFIIKYSFLPQYHIPSDKTMVLNGLKGKKEYIFNCETDQNGEVLLFEEDEYTHYEHIFEALRYYMETFKTEVFDYISVVDIDHYGNALLECTYSEIKIHSIEVRRRIQNSNHFARKSSKIICSDDVNMNLQWINESFHNDCNFCDRTAVALSILFEQKNKYITDIEKLLSATEEEIERQEALGAQEALEDSMDCREDYFDIKEFNRMYKDAFEDDSSNLWNID